MKNTNTWVAWLVLLISLLITFIATIYAKDEIDVKDAAKFRFECKEIGSKIEIRLHAHAQLLRSGAALFSATDTVSREDWRNFIEQSKVDLNLPGTQGIGYSLLIPKEKLTAHIQQIRNEGFPDYKVWPEGDREIYTSIIYLEPFTGPNLRAFGYDLMTEPSRRKALERARDMDRATLTDKILLVQETGTDAQAATIMYVPVYQKGMSLNSIEERRRSIIGWVSSPYRMNDLISGILQNWELEDNLQKFYLHIYDGLNYSSESLLFESHKPEEQKVSEKIRFSFDLPIDFNDQQWMLVFTQRKGNIFIDYVSAWGVLIGGFIISILLLLLTKSLINTKYNAQKIAETLTVELRESEFKLKKAQKISKIGSWGLDIINNKLEWSDEIYRIFDIEPQKIEATYERFLNYIHPDDRDMVNKAYSNSLVNTKPYEITHRLKLKDGTIKHVIEKFESVFDKNGNAIRSIGIVQDITEQKQAEERLQVSREQYRSIFENSPIGIYQSTPDGKIINANPTLLKMLEFDSLSELQNRNLEKEDYSEDSSISRQDFAEMINKDGYVKGLEESWTTRTGKVIPIRKNARIVKGKDDKILFYEGTVEDITERKKNEDQLRLIQEQYSIAIEGSNDGIWDWDTIANEVYFSPRWKSMLGYDDGELKNNFSTWENLLHPEDQKHALSNIQAYFNNEIPNYNSEFRMRHKDGSYRWIHARGKALRNENGNPYRMAGSHTDISKRKLTETALLNSEERFKIVAESAGEWVWEVNAKGLFTFSSPLVKQILGFTPEEIVGKKHFYDLFQEDVKEQLKEGAFNVIKQKLDIKDFESLNVHKNGKVVILNTSGSPVLDKEGNLKGYHGANSDITERKRIEKELKESENRLRTIIEASPVPIVLTKINDGVVIMANERLGKLFKISIAEATGQKSPDFYQNIEDRNSLLKAVVTDGYVDNFELVLKKSNGELFWCSVSLKIMSLDNEQVLIAGFHDITKRKNSEEEIMKHRENLEKMVAERTRELTISEQKLQQSVKVISDYKLALDESSLVSISDRKGIIKYANDKLCKVSKFRRDELIGNNHRIVNSGFHSKDFFINLWSIITKGEVWRGEIKNKAKDGSYYWVDSTIVPFLDLNGKPYQYVSVRFDVTSRKTIEADLIKSKEEADSANLAKSQFLANMSHEIRTPMNSVIGFSELLSKSVQDEKQRSQVESIRSSGKNLLKIINDILDLSKIEAGKIDILPVPINLCNLLSEVENMFAQKVKEKGVILSIDYEKIFPKTLLLDEVRFRQILFNLIGNAIKFTDIGQVSISIVKCDLSKEEENVDLIILVKDTGIGIPLDQQELIFDPFNQQTGQSAVKYGGTGLGLSITKKLIEKMGGIISLESEVGKGSTFRIDLPNIPVLHTDIDVKQKAFDTSKVLFEPATVLIVDDNNENRKLIIDLLENSPLTLLQAVNGQEAVEMANKYIPDLILMDLRMPVMDGYEATKILKNNKLTKSIPIITLTASIKSLRESDNIKEIFDEYLLKPVDIEQFFDKLKKHLKYELLETISSPSNYSTGKPEYMLTEELKKKIPGFIKTLELEFMPKYEKVIKNQVINEIEKFGLNLLDVSEKINCQIIIDYSNEIIVYAENFDFKKLMQTLMKFPEIVDWLKAEIKRK